MARWRANKRKQRTTREFHPGVNSSRDHIPAVGGRALDDYDLETGRARAPRKRRQLTLFVVFALILFAVVAGVVWSEASGFWEFMGAYASIGRLFVLVAAPFVLIAVQIYYYAGVGTEWPVATAFRLVMIGSMLGIVACVIFLAIGRSEDRLTEYGVIGWLALGLAVVGYVGQRD
jgi:hypothetical protein